MSQAKVQLATALPALLALLLLGRSLRLIFRDRRWSWTSTFVFVFAWLLQLPGLVGVYTGGLNITRDPLTNERLVIASGTVAQFQHYSAYLSLAWCIFVIMRR